MGVCSSSPKVKPARGSLEGAQETVPLSKADRGKESHSSQTSLGAMGNPFPKRPRFCSLSKNTWLKLEELFHKMDPDGSNAVTKEEARMFFKGTFGKVSADAMFNEVDVDGSGAITADEFVQFWVHVRKNGYKEKDVLEEVEVLLEGGAWVDWKDGRDTANSHMGFPARPFMCRLPVNVWQKCEELFKKMDTDCSYAITREKAKRHFKGAWANTSVDAMFNEIDVNHHGQITAKEFMRFWVQVKANGYKDKDIMDELENLLEGETWVDWKDGRSTA